MGQYVDVSPARQVESPIPIPELTSVSWQDPREGTTGGGGAHPVAVDLLSQVSAPECKASAEKKRPSRQARKRKFIREKREGDWPLGRTSVLPF